jgi:hypothetical protein
MRKVALVAVALVVVAGFGIGTATAGAAVRRGNDDFCEALANVSDDVGSDDVGSDDGSGSAIDPDKAEALADGLRRAAKEAPRKVKKAMKRLAKRYDRLADGDNPSSLFANERFLRDSLTYSTYYLDQCADITIPETDE